MLGIYKITNPKGKIYIGLSKNILKRFEHYKYACNIKSQKALYNSIKKYGSDKHLFEIIEILENETLLAQREVYWISYYNSYYYSNKKYGMNLTKGGNNPPVQNKKKTKEHIEKIRQSLLGKSRSEEIKNKIREKRKIQIISKEDYKKASLKRMKPCILYNKNTKEIIKAESLNEMIQLSKLSSAWLSKLNKKESKNYKFKYV